MLKNKFAATIKQFLLRRQPPTAGRTAPSRRRQACLPPRRRPPGAIAADSASIPQYVIRHFLHSSSSMSVYCVLGFGRSTAYSSRALHCSGFKESGNSTEEWMYGLPFMKGLWYMGMPSSLIALKESGLTTSPGFDLISSCLLSKWVRTNWKPHRDSVKVRVWMAEQPMSVSPSNFFNMLDNGTRTVW